MRPRQEIPIGSVLVEGGAHDARLRGDEIRVVGITGLGEVERIADPVGLAFTAVAGFQGFYRKFSFETSLAYDLPLR